MCNLAGYSGITNAPIDKIKLMALFGNRRGTDGFGIYLSGTLSKYGGLAGEGNSANIIYNTLITRNRHRLSNTVLMHNRQRSVGAITKENAHPYEYKDETKHWIFAHNGTIKNIEDLCKKYNIPYDFNKTDSYHFGELLFKQGFNILTEYEGAAALSILDVNSDILYLWKGFSEYDSYVASEERPLHFYSNNRCLYYSSEENALVATLNTENNIHSVPNNTLLEIDKGSIVNSVVFDRSHIKYVNKSVVHHYPVRSNPPTAFKEGEYKKENNPQNKEKNTVYFYAGHYYKNGHKLHGVYNIGSDSKPYQILNYVPNDGPDRIYFFYKGYMIKDYETFEKLIIDKVEPEAETTYQFAQKLHDDTILIRKLTNYTMYYKGNFTDKYYVAPIFSRFAYRLKDGNITFIALDYKTDTSFITKEESPKRLEDYTDDEYAEYLNKAYGVF